MGRRIQRNPRDRIESGSWRSTARPVDWPARVAAVIERDRVCQWPINDHGHLCGNPHDLECDHIGDPRDHRLENLRALCRTHHRRRTAQQAAAARRRNRTPRNRPPEKHPGLL